jgi:hypothetical protein
MSTVTLSSLAADVELSGEAQAALWAHLDLNPEGVKDIIFAAAIPQHILDRALDDLSVTESFPASFAGKVATLFTNIAAHVKPAVTPPADAAPSVVAPGSATDRGKMSLVLDQADERHFAPLTAEQRAKYRLNHETLTGGPPLDGRAPSTEQLAAMVTKLSWGEAPYVDFGVFTPHGRRMMKMHKFEAQVFVDSQLVSRLMKGPSTFDSWMESWLVFRALMICTVTVSSSTLDRYSQGIQQLAHQHPNHWGIIYCADEIMRGEIWTSTAENLFDLGRMPADMPWDLVLRLTSFGGSECTAQSSHWWKRHVEWPCQRTEAGARQYLQEVEGTHLLPFPEGFSAVDGSAARAPGRNRTRGNPRRATAWKQQDNQGPYPTDHGNGGKGHSKNSKGKGKDNKGKGKGKDHNKGGKPKGGKGAPVK